MAESDDRRPVRTPPHPLVTLVGTKAWVAILPLVLLLALETRGESPLFTPYSTVMGAGILGLLVYQAAFLVYYRHHAAEQGVYFPNTTGSSTSDTVGGVLFTALLDLAGAGVVVVIVLQNV